MLTELPICAVIALNPSGKAIATYSYRTKSDLVKMIVEKEEHDKELAGLDYCLYSDTRGYCSILARNISKWFGRHPEGDCALVNSDFKVVGDDSSLRRGKYLFIPDYDRYRRNLNLLK